MKILQIGRFGNVHHGGVERHFQQLVAGLRQKARVDCIVSSEGFNRTISKQQEHIMCEVPTLGTVASTALCPTMPYWVRKLSQQHRYDIVHLHFPNPMAHLASYFANKQSKLVITWHSDIVKQKRLLQLYQPFLRHVLSKADAVIVATPRHADESTQLFPLAPRDRIHVVHFGIDVEPFLNPLAIEASLAIKQQHAGKKIIFAIGRHVYYKGFEYLLQAMQQIEDAVLLLGGTGPLTAELQSYVKSHQLENKVILLGRVSDQDLPAYYHAADVFCMPSVERSEAFGLVQLEAMACKKPIVCCELNNGVTYLNQDGITGLVVPPRDPLALADALNKLLQDEALSRCMGEAGYVRVMTEFTLAKMCDETLSVYSQLMNAQ